MKKIFFTCCGIILCLSTFSQTFQSTIKQGTQAGSIFIVIKPSANLNDKPGNFQFTLAVPVAAGTRPALSLLNNRYASYFSSVAVIQTATYLTDYVYLVNFTGSALQNKLYSANKEDTVAEVLFAGTPSNIRLVQLPNGLATTGTGLENGNYNFYTEYVSAPADKTNATSMFYSATGGTVVNAATGYTGNSSVTVGAGALPLTWLSFAAEKQNENVLLKWRVANQINNDYSN